MNARSRLMLPLLLVSILLSGIILFLFISQQHTFQEKQRQQTAQRTLSVRNLLLRRIQETRSFVALVNHNPLVVNGVLTEDQGKVLDVISPFPEQASIKFLTIYNPHGLIFTQTEDAAIFGKSDELRPWLDEILRNQDTISTLHPLHQKIALLSGGMLRSLNEKIGFTVAGYYLDAPFIKELSTVSGADLALLDHGVLIASSLPEKNAQIPNTYQVTPIDLKQILEPQVGLSLVLLEDNTADANLFYLTLWSVVAPLSAAGVFVIWFTLRAGKSITRSHQTLQAEVIERQRTEHSLRQSEAKLKHQTAQLEQALKDLQVTQVHLIQAEKMSSLGQLIGGIAHEINNPISFIYGNIIHANEYMQTLMGIIKLYQKSDLSKDFTIQTAIEEADLDFIVEDFPNVLTSMKMGADRVRQIVLSLRNFSRLDETDKKVVDIHEGLESTLLILQNRLTGIGGRAPIQVIKDYAKLPMIECYAGQLNQVFLNILNNAIDALEMSYTHLKNTTAIPSNPTIWITTENRSPDQISIRIRDNGTGVPETVKQHIFDPFFTTKAVGQGTGMGLAISYQIVTKQHEGTLRCASSLGQGVEFILELPVHID